MQNSHRRDHDHLKQTVWCHAVSIPQPSGVTNKYLRAKQNQNNSMSSTNGLDALAALCGKTVSAAARNNGNGGGGSNDKSQRSGEESTVSASAPAPRPGPASSGQIPASNVGGTALPVFYQQQQLGQQQYFPQPQVVGMQQAAGAQQAPAACCIPTTCG